MQHLFTAKLDQRLFASMATTSASASASSTQTSRLNPPHNSIASPITTLKFTHQSYLLWKAQLVPYPQGQNFFGFVDVTPDSTAGSMVANPAYQTWFDQDKMILSAIISSLFEGVLYSTPLRSSSPQSKACIIQIYQLATLKKGSTPIANYFQKALLMQFSV